ncbi:hypothetical protein ACIFQM_17845 [Paenibacillus sp. NRS-1782]|uniref:hypothetical protein n=1 Tax=unclassified Paenibacillus TaxID=185978 RepID=UPI003D2D9201
MKNIKKASLLSVLSLAVAIPLTASAAATTEVTPATTDSAAVSQSANTSTTRDHVITPQSTQPAFDTTLGGQQSEASFSIPAGMGYVKLWVRNTGTETIKFAVHKDSSSGSVMSGTEVRITPGDTFSWISSSAWPTGRFYATFNTSNTKMSGQAYGKLASTRSEL